MKKMWIALSVILALIIGLSLGGILALNKNYTSYLVSKEEENSYKANKENNTLESESNKSQSNTVKEEIENNKVEEKEKEVVQTKKVTNVASKKNTDANEKAISKDYNVYYYINDFIENDSGKYLVLDRFYMYYDSNYDNDYYTVNNNTKLRTYKLSSNVKIRILDVREVVYPSKYVDYYRFKEHMNSDDEYTTGIIDIKLNGDEIVGIEEIYVP